METDEREWSRVARRGCTRSGHALGASSGDELATELWADTHWRSIEHEQAAVEWLRQGMPNAA